MSSSSKKSSLLQSSGEIEDGWGEGEEEGAWRGATDERGFDTSGATKGSWSRRQQENFERLRSEQFSPTLPMTPDIPPSARVTRRKLKEVQRWVHEVTIHTQQREVEETLALGEGGGGREVRMAVVPEELASRKVLDLRRW